MKVVCFFMAICIWVISGYPELHAQSLPDSFQQLLQQNGMRFTVPSGFVRTPVVANGDVEYDFALKSETVKLEIRYRIWPFDAHSQGKPNRNSMFMTMLMTMGLNISNGIEPKATRYPPDDVKREFGADAGGSCAVRTDSEFGTGYKFCVISVIHKDDVADAYVFYLCDDPTVAMRAIGTESIYHALTFR